MWYSFALSKADDVLKVFAAFTNKFAGQCPVCGQMVEPGEGLTEKNPDGGFPKWLNFHRNCFSQWTAMGDELAKREFSQGKPQAAQSGEKPNFPNVEKKFILSTTQPETGIATFSYSPNMVLAIKMCFPSARYHKELEGHTNCWTIPVAQEDLKHIVKTFEGFGFWVDPKIQEKAQQHLPIYHEGIQRGLFEFQAEDSEWLSMQKRALIGHEMGLGKTAISLCALPKDKGIIVVCPLAVAIDAWVNGIKQWRPELKPILIGNKNEFRFPQPGEVIIANYERVPDVFLPPMAEFKGSNGKMVQYRDIKSVPQDIQDSLSECCIIVDEAHMVKNKKSAKSIKVKTLSTYAQSAWLLTGTPLANRPPDLFGVLTAGDMIPQTFHSVKRKVNGEDVLYKPWDIFCSLMNAEYGAITTKPKKQKAPEPGDAAKLDEEQIPTPTTGGTRIRIITGWGQPSAMVPGILGNVMINRRKSDEDIKDTIQLPPKDYTNIVVDLEDPALQRELDMGLAKWAEQAKERAGYEDDLEQDIGGGGAEPMGSMLPPFEEFSKIRADLARYKIEAAQKIIADYEAQNKPLLVFSAHVDPVKAIGSRPGWAMIYGGTASAQRAQIVNDFQNGKLKGVALTIGAGGVGITLTRAATSLFIDMSWLPGDNSQAEARTHRIGQKSNQVNIIRLLVDHPMDTHVCKLLDMKQQWVEKAVNEKKARLDEDAESGDDDNRTIVVDGATKKLEDCTEEEILQAMYATASEEALTNKTSGVEGVAATTTRQPRAARPAPPSAGIVLSDTQKTLVWNAVQALKGVCDGARSLDDCGFNKLDSGNVDTFMTRLQARRFHPSSQGKKPTELITDGEYQWLVKLLKKYSKTQLGESYAGIWQSAPTPEAPAIETPAQPIEPIQE